MPARERPLSDERNKGQIKKLINACEVGRRLQKRHPTLAERAMRGELPIANKGGILMWTAEIISLCHHETRAAPIRTTGMYRQTRNAARLPSFWIHNGGTF